jgi:Holliday junction resolvase RusA-like endonuclease
MIEFTVEGDPVPYARMQGGKSTRRFIPAKQRAAMDALAWAAAKAMRGRPLIEGPVLIHAIFSFEHPASWSKAKRGATFYKTSKPDSDNLTKLAMDAFKGVVWIDDSQVCFLAVSKIYSHTAYSTFMIAEGNYADSIRGIEIRATTSDGCVIRGEAKAA